MLRLSYPTETVLSNKITRNRIVLSFKDCPRKPLRRWPMDYGRRDGRRVQIEIANENSFNWGIVTSARSSSATPFKVEPRIDVQFVSSSQSQCFVFFQNFCLPFGLYSICSTSPKAGWTCQKCSTKYHNWGDDAQCIWLDIQSSVWSHFGSTHPHPWQFRKIVRVCNPLAFLARMFTSFPSPSIILKWKNSYSTEFPIPSFIEVFRIRFREFPRLVGCSCS